MNPDAVRHAALRLLVLSATDPTPEPVPDELRERCGRLLLEGMGERGIASALGLSLDEVRAMLVRLARNYAAK